MNLELNLKGALYPVNMKMVEDILRMARAEKISFGELYGTFTYILDKAIDEIPLIIEGD